MRKILPDGQCTQSHFFMQQVVLTDWVFFFLVDLEFQTLYYAEKNWGRWHWQSCLEVMMPSGSDDRVRDKQINKQLANLQREASFLSSRWTRWDGIPDQYGYVFLSAKALALALPSWRLSSAWRLCESRRRRCHAGHETQVSGVLDTTWGETSASRIRIIRVSRPSL